MSWLFGQRQLSKLKYAWNSSALNTTAIRRVLNKKRLAGSNTERRFNFYLVS